MSLTQEEILHLARLSKLHITPENAVSFQKELEPIMDYMKVLDSVPQQQLDKIEEKYGHGLVPRLDEVIPKIDREELLACSPQKIIHHQIAVDNISSRV